MCSVWSLASALGNAYDEGDDEGALTLATVLVVIIDSWETTPTVNQSNAPRLVLL